MLGWLALEGDAKEGERPVCPRCGGRGTGLYRQRSGRRVYVYFRHGRGARCYLGPESGYVYVTKTHSLEGLELKGLHEEGRAVDYIERLLDALADMALEGRVDPADVERLAARIERLLEVARDAQALREA